MEPVEFKDTRLWAGWSKLETARELGVTVRTVDNWEKGVTAIPYAASELLRLKTGCVLPSPGWNGWTIVNGGLVSPVGDLFTAGGLEWLSLTFEMARSWQRQNVCYPEDGWQMDWSRSRQVHVPDAWARERPAAGAERRPKLVYGTHTDTEVIDT